MRTAEFDRPTVLRAAMQLFMDKGYSKTSMQALKAATGLHPGSLYAAFANKEGLLLEALKQYHQDRQTEFEALYVNVSPWQGLENYVMQLTEECLSGDPQKGCLSHKAMNELTEQLPAVSELVKSNFNSWHQSLSKVLASAQEEGEISSMRNPDDLAHFLIMGIYGLRSYSHCRPDPKVLYPLVEQLLEGLKHSH